MKKLIVACSLMVVAANVSAQGTGKPSVHDISSTRVINPIRKIGPSDVIFSGANVKEGANTLAKADAGRLEFTRSKNTISKVVFYDNAGNATMLMPEPGTTGTIPAGAWDIRTNTKTGLFRLLGDPQ